MLIPRTAVTASWVLFLFIMYDLVTVYNTSIYLVDNGLDSSQCEMCMQTYRIAINTIVK